MEKDIAVLGVGAHPWGKFKDKDFVDLAVIAANEAFKDAGIGWKDIQAMVCAETVWSGKSGLYAGQFVSRALGSTGIPAVNIQNGCASGAVALAVAAMMIKSGMCDIALAIGGDVSPEGFLPSLAGEDPLSPDSLRFTAIGATNPVHWAQGKVYAYIYMQEHLDVSMSVRLTYMHRKTREITSFHEYFTREELTIFFDNLVEEYSEWVSLRLRWMARRNESIQELNFPYPEYRMGQRNFAVSVYRAIADKEVLFAEAPTGIGKTMAVQHFGKALMEGRPFPTQAENSEKTCTHALFVNVKITESTNLSVLNDDIVQNLVKNFRKHFTKFPVRFPLLWSQHLDGKEELPSSPRLVSSFTRSRSRIGLSTSSRATHQRVPPKSWLPPYPNTSS